MPESYSGRPILAAIRAELGVLEARMAKLRELERLAVQLEGDPAAAAPAPRADSPPRRRSGGRRKPGELALEILRVLQDGPLTSPELAARLGAQQGSIDPALKQLFGGGKVQHDDGRPKKWSLMPTFIRNGHSNGNGGTSEPPLRAGTRAGVAARRDRRRLPRPSPRHAARARAAERRGCGRGDRRSRRGCQGGVRPSDGRWGDLADDRRAMGRVT